MIFCQQIDIEAVIEMSNEDLAKYVTKLGDKCAIRRFCAKDNSPSMKGKAKKTSLLEKMKKS